jgi:hypothetical protein
MAATNPVTSTLGLIRAPIVDRNTGIASRDMVKWLQKIEAKTNTSLTLLGEITGIISGVFSGTINGPGTTVTSTAAALSNLASILQNLDQLGVVLPPGIDFTRSYVAKNSDNIPSGATTMIPTQARMNSATDAAGNLLLKNISNSSGVTSNPSTSSTTPSVLPEMTTTITTQGNKVYISWGIGFRTSTLGGTAFFQVYRDGGALGPLIEGTSPNNASQNSSVAASWIDTGASAGSHTYQIQWWTTAGTTATADLANRAMEVVELG